MAKKIESGSINIKGRSYSKNEIISVGEKRIQKGTKTRKGWGVAFLVLAGLGVVGVPVAAIQKVISGAGEIAGAIVGAVMLAGIGVLLILQSKKYPNKVDPYEVGSKYITRHTTHPSQVEISRKKISTSHGIEHGHRVRIDTYLIEYEDGHTETVDMTTNVD